VNRSALKTQLRELLRFGLVGGSAVAVDGIVYFGLTGLVACPTSLAKAISFIAGACLAFLLNRGFVFRAEGTASQQILPFTALYLVSLGLNNGVNAAALALAVAKPLAWLAATATSTISNFIGMKYIVFRKRRLEAAHSL
jgi:putative flippase GtrA